MRKIKMMTSAVLLSLSLAFSLTACGTKSEPAADTTAAEAEVTETESEAETAEEAANDEEEKVKVGVSWNADEIDALVVTGGEDIDPSYYDEEPNEKLETVNEVRDTSDSLLIKAALDEDIPMLCTCRGMQFLNVLSGGTLYQDLPTQNPSDIDHRDPNGKVFAKHEITVDKDNIVAAAFGGEGTYTVNSWHHQAVDQLGDNLKVVATAPDGVVEAIVREDKDYVMGLQFHPEAMIAEGDDSFLAFYTNLIDQAKEAE